MTEQQQYEQRNLDPAQVEADTVTGIGKEQSVSDSESKQNSLWSDAWASLKRNPLFWIGAVLGVFFVTMAIAPQLFARGADPRACDLTNSSGKPSAEHWMGFDQQGCDYLANVVYGARNSLAIGLFSVLGVLVLGVIIGAIAGYYGGITDSIFARITDIFFAIPLILGALILLR